jgi:hypothetical protein
MTDATKINGGCYCGDITIVGDVSSDKVMACHFTDCQKFSGAPFRAVAVIAADDVKISGTVTEFLKIAESSNKRVQGFCGKCGSHLYADDPVKTLFMVRTGCLDEIPDSSWVAEGQVSAAMTPFKKA